MVQAESLGVRLDEYSREWPRLFEMEAGTLHKAFAPMEVRVEHIGSTAVPGMCAKPIVDILLGASSLASIEQRLQRILALGYRYVPEFESELPHRRYFVKPAGLPSRFHLHAVKLDEPFWHEHIAFRDALRTDPRVFNDYLALKRRLAATSPDREQYTSAKEPFIREILARR